MIRNAVVTTGLALAMLSGVASYKSHKNEARTQVEHPPLGKFIDIDGTTIHYFVEGSGPPLVLIHGAGGNLRDFTFQLTGKLAQTHTVITFDRPGHGYTDTIHNTGESLAEQAALLHTATQRLGYDKVIVAGYSFGGAVALRWALDYQQDTDGLLLMSAVSNPWVLPPSKIYEVAAGRLTGPILSTSLSAFAPKSLIEDTLRSIFSPQQAPKGYLKYVGAGLSLQRRSIQANGRQVHRLLPQIEEQSLRYHELTLPIEIIHGDADITVPPSVHADVLAKQLPHANYARLKNVGHSVHHHGHAEILSAVSRLTR